MDRRKAKMKKRKEIDKKENKEAIMKKAKEAGLDFVNHELPPEEVDEALVQKTNLSAFLSLIPFTSEYYESLAAEEELDNLKKIRIEKVKAADYLSKSKIGQHDEALDDMMAETNYDFFYFNKLRTKLEAEGKFKFEKPELNPFATLGRSQNRNRLKKAINLDIMDYSDLLGGGESGKIHMFNQLDSMSKKDDYCIWSGKNKLGEAVKCNNFKMKIRRNAASSKYNANIISLENAHHRHDHENQYCCYHVHYCIGDHPEDEMVEIKTPNSESLCAECYQIKMNRKPLPLTVDTVPGVTPVTLLSRAKLQKNAAERNQKMLGKSITTKSKVLKRPGYCNWEPHDEVSRQYMCTNKIYMDPITNQQYDQCIWHLVVCLQSHPSGDANSAIQCPNIHGLCVMHHISVYGQPPPIIPMPYPGMKIRRSANYWLQNLGRHWSIPVDEPIPKDIISTEYELPASSYDALEMLIFVCKRLVYHYKRIKYGKKAILRIQTFYRMYRVKNIHFRMMRQRLIKDRMNSSILIQTQMRRYLTIKHTKEKRRKYRAAIITLQRVYRGHFCRLTLYIDWAAKRIQRFMKKLHFFRFRDSVIMIMQLRRLFLKRLKNVLFLQRIYRGYAARRAVFIKKYWTFVYKRSVKIISKYYQRYQKRLEALKYHPPGEDWAKMQCGYKLAYMILDMYLDRKSREEFAVIMKVCATIMQKVVRGFLARCKVTRKRLKKLKKLEEKRLKLLSQSASRVNVERPSHVRNHLPAEFKHKSEVSHQLFDIALDHWYHESNTPLVASEKNSLIKRFKNPMSGNILVSLLDEYIELYKLPCRKHGRKICGDCYFRKNCLMKSCNCKRYKMAPSHLNAICVQCDHPGTLHVMYPLQYLEKVGNESLIEILVADRDPDMSIPLGVHGVEASKAIIPIPTIDDQRSVQIKESRRKQIEDFHEKETEPWSLTKSLTIGERVGDTIHDDNEYWGQTSHDVLTVVKPSSPNANKIIPDNVQFSYEEPNYNVSQHEFWNTIVSKNPNKKVRDYHEKFDHNMPVPIVHHGQMVYSLEGPKIYYNILKQIIAMEKEVHFDNPNFLKLITENIQIFERHWRKMVVDIRQGKLDRLLTIPNDMRMLFESMNIPRPSLSIQLDKTFRKLGFHKKVLGKDIQIRSYAKLKKLPHHHGSHGSHRLKPIKRRNSERLNRTDSNDLERLLSNSASKDSNMGSMPGIFPSPKAQTLNSKRLLSDSFDSNASDNPITRRVGLSRDGLSPQRKKSPIVSKRQLLLEFSQSMNETDKNSTRPNCRISSRLGTASTDGGGETKRRGSDTNILQPISLEDVTKFHYEQHTAPRDSYSLTLKMDGDRYVCPFPACGKSFHSQNAAFRHIPIHEQRTRLYAPTPLPDSHLSFYWPHGVPWFDAPKYSQRTIPPGSLQCYVKGCLNVFPTKLKLVNHLRIIHAIEGNSSIAQGYFQVGGDAIQVPPNKPPRGVPFRYCPLHMMPLSKCHTCSDLESIEGPKPPVKFYPMIQIDFLIKQQKKLKSLSETVLNKNKNLDPHSLRNLHGNGKIDDVKFHPNDWNHGVIIVEDNMISSPWKGQVMALLVDKNDDGWFGVRRLFTYKEAISEGFQLPNNFDKKYELYQSKGSNTSSNSMKDDAHFKWIPIFDIHDTFQLSKIQNHELTLPMSKTINAFYVRQDDEKSLTNRMDPSQMYDKLLASTTRSK